MSLILSLINSSGLLIVKVLEKLISFYMLYWLLCRYESIEEVNVSKNFMP